MDLIEIDAASNRGIDEIRQLRDTVQFNPAQLRYRFYIIDECHQLTPPAWNAFLKTLEEPPPHVIFVLATTEAHKLPATIVSRCQRFDFRRITLEAMIARHASHSLHGRRSGSGLRQFAAFASKRAVLVLPVPRGPQKRYACASRPCRIWLFRVRVMCSCPMNSSPSNVVGR